MLHSGATYYLYICVGTTQIDLHTSSNGVDFTLDTAAVIARGAGGTWDASAIGNLAVIVDGATWRMAYEAHGVGAGWEVGTATSANGRTWTKNPSNPVMGNSAAGTGFGGPALFKIGSTYWCWGHVNGTLPTDGGRFSSPDFVTWTRSPNETSLLTFGAVPAAGHLTLPRLETDEGAGLNTGQVADLSLVEVSGRTYIFYTASPDGVTNFKIKRAVANLTMAQLVTTDETPAVTPGSVIIAPLANTDQIEVTQADRKTVLFDIDPATGTQTIYARTAGGQGPAKLVLRSFKNAEASATDAAITCNWWASGCILTLPRDVGGHGYHLQNHAGQDILYLDSSDKKATLPGYAGTGQSFACFDAAGKLVRSDTACR